MSVNAPCPAVDLAVNDLFAILTATDTNLCNGDLTYVSKPELPSVNIVYSTDSAGGSAL